MAKKKIRLAKNMVKVAIPLIAWALMLFLVLALPPLMGLDNPFSIGMMVWMILVSNVTSWFVSALQRYVDEVAHG